MKFFKNTNFLLKTLLFTLIASNTYAIKIRFRNQPHFPKRMIIDLDPEFKQQEASIKHKSLRRPNDYDVFYKLGRWFQWLGGWACVTFPTLWALGFISFHNQKSARWYEYKEKKLKKDLKKIEKDLKELVSGR